MKPIYIFIMFGVALLAYMYLSSQDTTQLELAQLNETSAANAQKQATKAGWINVATSAGTKLFNDSLSAIFSGITNPNSNTQAVTPTNMAGNISAPSFQSMPLTGIGSDDPFSSLGVFDDPGIGDGSYTDPSTGDTLGNLPQPSLTMGSPGSTAYGDPTLSVLESD